MKGWKFSDGQTRRRRVDHVLPEPVQGGPDLYCGYNAGYGIPDQLASATGTGNTVTLNFNRTREPELDPVQLPLRAVPDARGLGQDLARRSGRLRQLRHRHLRHAATDDGLQGGREVPRRPGEVRPRPTPTRCGRSSTAPGSSSSFDSLGNATFVPNATYSGPQKAQVGRRVPEGVHDRLRRGVATSTQDSSRSASSTRRCCPAPHRRSGRSATTSGIHRGNYNLLTGYAVVVQLRAAQLLVDGPEGRDAQAALRPPGAPDVDRPGRDHQAGRQGYGVPTCSPIPPEHARATISANVAVRLPLQPGARQGPADRARLADRQRRADL